MAKTLNSRDSNRGERVEALTQFAFAVVEADV